jgi:hypothetical protein
MNAPTISPETAAHVLAHYGHSGGYPAGRFTEQLIIAIDTADPANRDRLAEGFPGLVAAITAIQYDPDGVAYLQALARSFA